MITFADLGAHGRLGNQLFQYAALKSLGLSKGYEVKIPNPSSRLWHGQECLLDNFSLECGFLTQQDTEEIKYLYLEPDINRYDKNIISLPDHTNLLGFFQSTKYFTAHSDQIRKEFQLKRELDEECREHILKLKRDHGCEIVSVHLRRGDQTDGTNPSSVNFYGKGNHLEDTSIYGSYFNKAKEVFKNRKIKFLVFSGGSRKEESNASDLEWCKYNFKDDIFLFAEGNSTIKDFGLIKSCDHNITCHSTSFGWWAAYLNENPSKIVTAPKYYFVEDRTLTREGFYPDNWNLLL